ncbi:MAG: DNA methyltransferase [Candidatus Paceibacterota bacterium]|jgi:DNA modification methylase
MKTFILIKNKKELDLPEEFRDEDIRYPENFVELFLNEFTKEGDVVFDPFAGYGTTLRVAERMKRIGYGTEYDEKRANYAKSLLADPEHLIFGDALKISEYNLPSIDFSITSPLYMQKGDENPFKTKMTEKSEYDQYLQDMKKVYSQIKDKLKDGGRVVIEVSNLKNGDEVTTLAWDICRAVSEILHFEGEIIVASEDKYGCYGYNHSYALVFRK